MRKTSGAKTALNIILSVILALCVVLTIFAALYTAVFTNKDVYLKKCLTDEYYEATIEYVKKSLTEATTSLVSINNDELMRALDTDEIKELAREYMTSCIYCIFENSGMPDYPSYKSDELKKLINKAIVDSVGNAPDGVITDERIAADTEKAYELLTQYVGSSITFVPTAMAKIMVRAGEIIAKLEVLKNVALISSAALVLISTIKIFVNRKESLSGKIYRVAAPLWIGSVAAFSPIMILKIYNLPSRVAVDASSTLRYFIEGLINGIISNAFVITLCILIIATIVLGIAIYFLSFKNGSPAKVNVESRHS